MLPTRTPIRRDYRFELPAERVGDWHPLGRHVSHFFNALSLFFPDGERFFIAAVRHYRERIGDPELSAAVAGFIGQEAMHGREHEEYNELLDRAGLPGSALVGFVARFLARLKKVLSPMRQLSATIALEHFTAIMANVLLSDPRILAGAEPHYARLWRWHALEETEHKAVAFDVYTSVYGRGLRAYLVRVTGLIGATLIFWPLVFGFHLRLLRADPQARGLRGWLRLLDFLFGRYGALRKLVKPWLDYFRPRFHPWDHDNRRFLHELDRFQPQASAAG